MNKKISELFDYGDEIVIDEEIGDLFDPEEIKEMTMTKIHAQETSHSGGRRKLSRRAAALIAAAACLALLGTAAYASGLFFQQYNWKGEAVGEPQTMHPVDEEKVIEVRSLSDAQTIQAILDDRTGRELVIVRDLSGNSFSLRSEPVRSIEELRDRLEAEASPLRVPYEVPAGYVLEEGYVAYDSTGGYTLISSEERADGLRVDRYAAPPENDFISGYRLDYENEAGNHLFIYTLLSPEAAYGFSAADGETMKAVEVAGMDEALLQTYESGATLFMLQYLAEPISYEDRVTLAGFDETGPFTEVYYLFNARGVDAESQLQMLRP